MQKTITITNKKEFLNTLKTFKLNTEKKQEISKLTYFSIDYINKSLTIKNSDLDNYLINTFAIENDLTLPDYLINAFAIENNLALPDNQEFLLNTKELLDAVNSCKKMDTLEIVVKNNFITIGAFNLFFKNCEETHQRDLEIFKKSIETEKLENNLKNLLEFNIDKNLFIKNLKNSLNFASNDETRPYLQGVAIKFKDNGLGFYATTGHFLIKINNFDNLDIIDNSNNNFFILPIKLCKNLVASADILKDNIKIIFNNKDFVKIFSENLKIKGRLFDAEFPDANTVIPSTEAFKIELKTKAFFDAVKMANNVADSDNHNKITLNFNNNKLLLTKKKQDNIIFQLPLDFNSDNEVSDYAIIFNSKLLLKCIETYKNFTNQDNIFISFQSDNKGRPVKIECLDANKQVITILLLPHRF